VVVVEVECFINDIDSGKKKSETRHNGIGEKGEREREKRILFRIDPFMMADCKLDTLGVSIIFFISNSTGW